MPWQESSVEEERLRFVVLASRKHKQFSTLCEEFGISRQTGYTWLKRYEAGGSTQVVDRSRRPIHSPSRTVAEIEQAVVELRQRWPDWGAPKLHKLLLQQHPQAGTIAVRTVHRILQRHQLVRSQPGGSRTLQRFERSAPNELWQMDFKGPAEGYATSRVGPLSLLDDHSRYLLALKHLGSTQMQGVQCTLQRVFEQCGVPDAMLMDHGTPWWNAASPWGWTELTVWMMRQGIRVMFSGLGHPQTQGKVERMHGSLQQARRYRQGADFFRQDWLDLFRYEYNYIRPHAALALATPASRWCPSLRVYRNAPPDWQYPETMKVLRLAGEGQLNWYGRRWEISSALRGQLVGLDVMADQAIVYFCRTPLRELDLRTGASSILPADVYRSSLR